ncbi:hypothetical protein AX279_24445 [Pseudomonas sp. J237]|nr:hypothetical protein AX279_24445 [Pseudomonas sp. J237]
MYTPLNIAFSVSCPALGIALKFSCVYTVIGGEAYQSTFIASAAALVLAALFTVFTARSKV